ncbi:MAG: YkgJ family cysteine cluster protein [Treponemataceae bacterium]|nr:YkgJ family cysteine cluster protein [Treponemataceae bacterium]
MNRTPSQPNTPSDSLPFRCRPGCGACCIWISISSPIPPAAPGLPGMPSGKAAGTPCIHLDEHRYCRIHNTPYYPEVCRNFTPRPDTCGASYEEAREILSFLEEVSRPE